VEEEQVRRPALHFRFPGGVARVTTGLEILPETQPEKRVAAVPEGDEESVDPALSPGGGSTTRTVTAAALNPNWRCAKQCS
jgi:hypothetical protein